MITLRHHVLTIVAVFLALAVGIVLGGGPLSDVGTRVTTAGNEEKAAPVEAQVGADYNASFLSAVGPTLLSGRLTDQSVAVVTVPGADEQLVTALTDGIAGAGGTVSARYTLGADLVDPGQKSLVDTLGSQLLTQPGGDAVAADASTYDRIGQLLGLAVASKEAGGEDVNGKARAILDAFSGASLVEQPGDVTRRAPLVLLVLGTDAGDEGSDAVLAGLVEGLAAQAKGVVVVGSLQDGGAGQLGRLRADPAAGAVASVDGIDVTAGRVATILTLQRSATTPGGSFGASGADGAVPLG